MEKEYQNSRNAAEITINKIAMYEELNALDAYEAEETFKQKTRELWQDFAVHGLLQYDRNEGKQILKAATDLDGQSAICLMQYAGINVTEQSVSYVKPGEHIEGAINLDTGDKFGVEYDAVSDTAYFDHHAKGSTEITSATQIVYETMADMGMFEKTIELDRAVDFVTKIDNRKYPAAEFLKSGKTILGLQRDLNFDTIVEYFKDHTDPTEELTIEEFSKYGLEEAAIRQQEIVDESMRTLAKMEQEYKCIRTEKYGEILLNVNNELKTGSSAAYVRYDGIINITPEKSFAVTLKDKDFDETELREKLGDKFQGKIIRGKMWIYNDEAPLQLSALDIERAIIGNGFGRGIYDVDGREYYSFSAMEL